MKIQEHRKIKTHKKKEEKEKNSVYVLENSIQSNLQISGGEKKKTRWLVGFSKAAWIESWKREKNGKLKINTTTVTAIKNKGEKNKGDKVYLN